MLYKNYIFLLCKWLLYRRLIFDNSSFKPSEILSIICVLRMSFKYLSINNIRKKKNMTIRNIIFQQRNFRL